MKALILGTLLALALPASAGAQAPLPPSNSAANQYVEDVPTASGNRPTTGITRRESARPLSSAAPGPLAPSTSGALAHQGADGAGTAALVRATAPPRPRHRSGAGRPRGGGVSGAGVSGGGSSGDGASPPATVFQSLTGFSLAGGLGAVLPVILILSALGVRAVVLRRRRSS